MLKNVTKGIYIKDWLGFKPYTDHTNTDLYYLQMCNKVKRVLMHYEFELAKKIDIDNDELNDLACILTSYFEDLISGTNIWNSFVRMHHKMYGKPLPFYSSDDYFEDEINLEDVCFLIWYYINAIQDEKMLAPQTEFIMAASIEVMDIFEEAWENAPENTQLLSCYQIDPNEDDYYLVRELIDTVLFKTYLFYIDTATILGIQIMDLFEQLDETENALAYMNEVHDSVLQRSHTRLLSKRGCEWVAEILGSEHPLSNDLRNMSPKIEGFFLYKGTDDKNLFMEHIASGRTFGMLIESYDRDDLFAEVDTIVRLGIVRWKGEWWFSGVSTISQFDADLILDEKNSVQSRMQVNFLDEGKEMDDIMQEQFETFKAFNDGLQIAFMPSEKVESFINGYHDFYNDSLKLSAQERKEALQRSKRKGITGYENMHLDLDENARPGLVFFNPESGIEMAFGLNKAFPLPNNPYFEIGDGQSVDVFPLLFSEEFSTQLALFCIDNCKDRLPFFTEGLGGKFLPDLDFLLRFWKRSNYHAKSGVTLIGKDKVSVE